MGGWMHRWTDSRAERKEELGKLCWGQQPRIRTHQPGRLCWCSQGRRLGALTTGAQQSWEDVPQGFWGVCETISLPLPPGISCKPDMTDMLSEKINIFSYKSETSQTYCYSTVSYTFFKIGRGGLGLLYPSCTNLTAE